jgi:uncharacterized protein YndB with AHSA1/START domain
MNAVTNTNVIQKKIDLNAPLSRVWRAPTYSREFGAWFGVELKDAFVAGKTVSGRFTLKGNDRMWEATIQRIEPEHTFSFTWHPCGGDDGDHSGEAQTLVEFKLEAKDGRTVLTVIESGFDNLPVHRRATVFAANDGGWTFQLGRISNYLENGKV